MVDYYSFVSLQLKETVEAATSFVAIPPVPQSPPSDAPLIVKPTACGAVPSSYGLVQQCQLPQEEVKKFFQQISTMNHAALPLRNTAIFDPPAYSQICKTDHSDPRNEPCVENFCQHNLCNR